MATENLRALGVDLPPDDATDEEEEVDIDSLVPDEKPEDALFIPLTLAKKLPPHQYESADSEWQTYHEFAHDEEKMNQATSKIVPLCDPTNSSPYRRPSPHSIPRRVSGQGHCR